MYGRIEEKEMKMKKEGGIFRSISIIGGDLLPLPPHHLLLPLLHLHLVAAAQCHLLPRDEEIPLISNLEMDKNLGINTGLYECLGLELLEELFNVDLGKITMP
jgi:hypothetical protein